MRKVLVGDRIISRETLGVAKPRTLPASHGDGKRGDAVGADQGENQGQSGEASQQNPSEAGLGR